MSEKLDPSEATKRAYNDLLLRECIDLWQDKYGGEIDCPCCLFFYDDRGCSCHLCPPCGFCTREIDCEHTIGDCVELLGIDDYNKLVKG